MIRSPFISLAEIEAWHKAHDSAGLHRPNIYALRHFYNNWLRARGVSGSMKARLMGHTTEKVAEIHYDQFGHDELRRIVE